MKRNNKITAKILSMFLAILFVFYALPLSAIAEGISNLSSDNGTDIASSDSAANQSTKATTYLNDVYEDISLREESVKHFRLEDGSYIATQYSSPVHYRDESGAWQNIDNTLTESGSELVTSDARVKFIKKTTGNGSIFTLHDGNTKITLSLAGANKKVSGIVTNTEETETTEIGKLMSLEGLTSRIRYNEILDGVDIEYVLDSLSIKENIIIKEKSDEYSYTFTLALNGLEAELLSSGDISITKSGEHKYTIPAPVVFDSADSTAPATAAGYSLTDNGNGKYALTVSVSSEWMNSSDRVYPVTLDPAIVTGTSSIIDTYGTPGTPSSNGLSETLKASADIILMSATMPTLPIGAKISEVTLTLHRKSGTGAYVGAYLIDGSFGLSSYDVADTELGELLDYCYTKSNDDGTYGIDNNGSFVWNVTKAFETRYTGVANIKIALTNVRGAGATVFHSTESSTEALRPSFSVSYVNTLGLEDYCSYSTQSGGAAGTGYVNYATGDLTFAISTLTSTDYLMPVTPTLVYNSALANKSYTSANVTTPYTSSVTPYGFKLNLAESLVRRNYSSEGATVYYYVWSDADGTEHYFYPTDDPTVFIDDSGLLMTLTVPTSGNPTITDVDKNARVFVSYGSSSGSYILRDFKDKVGNKVYFVYNTSNQISAIKLCPGGSSGFVTLELYYTNGVLYQVLNRNSNKSVFLKYSDTYNGEISTTAKNYLRQVVYAHGTDDMPSWTTFYSSGATTDVVADATMYYEYDANGYLLSAKNGLADYTVNYEWTDGKVTSIYEKGGATEGVRIGFEYGMGYTEVTTPGGDGYYSTTADNIINVYSYDKYYRVNSTYSTNSTHNTVYGASNGVYGSSESAKNKLTETFSLSGASTNYIINGDFLMQSDNDPIPYWETSHTTITTGSDSRDETVQIPCATAGEYHIYQYVRLPHKGEYTLSFDVASSDLGDGITVKSIVLSDEQLVNVDITDEAREWYTCSQTFSIPSSVRVLVKFTVTRSSTAPPLTTTPTVYISKVRLEEGSGSGPYNYVATGDFFDSYSTESVSNPTDVNLNTFWDKSSSSVKFVTSQDAPFSSALEIDGSVSFDEYALQTVYTAPSKYISSFGELEFSSNAGKTYVISGFAKAPENAVANSRSKFAIRVDVYYYQGEGVDEVVKSYYFNFNEDHTDWQFISGTFTTAYEAELGDNNLYEVVSKIDVACEYSYQPDGKAYFDRIAMTDAESQNVSYEYENGQVAVIRGSFENEYRDYDSEGRLIREADESGNLTIYEYDDDNYGLLSSVTTYTFSATGLTPTIYPYYTFVTEEIDGQDITYRNPLAAIEVLTPKLRTAYTYDDYGLITKIETYPAVMSGNKVIKETGSASIVTENTYITTSGSPIFGALETTYDKAGTEIKYFYDTAKGYLLAEVNTGAKTGTAYTYDAIGNLTYAKPATYSSTSGTYSAASYSNVNYEYNTKNELYKITTSTSTYTFTYDKFGNLARFVEDNISYVYDKAGKLTSMYCYNSDGNYFEYIYTYDDLGRLITESYSLEIYEEYEEDGEIYSDWYYVEGILKEYEYNSDGQLHRVHDVENDEYIQYNYDANGRLVSVITYDSSMQNDFVTEYSYSIDPGLSDRVSKKRYSFTYLAGTTPTNYFVSTLYSYDSNERLYKERFLVASDVEIQYTYDDFNRISSKTTTGGNYTNEDTYGYKTVNGVTTGEVSDYTVNVGSTTNSTTKNYTYTYDGRGNIKTVSLDNVLQYEYYYDDLGQLYYVVDYVQGLYICYYYDNAGNLYERYVEGINDDTLYYDEFTYASSPYGDRLVDYNGESITYDSYGRTTSYCGKLITYLESDPNKIASIGNISFTYDANGMRRSKTVNGVIHYYTYDGINLIREEWGNNTLVFLYDASGSPIGMQYRNSSKPAGDWDTYYYEKNLQGDIVAVYNSSGTKLVTYTYDAWGYIISTTYSNGGSTTGAQYNPLKYRGYYYDDDLDLYYLATRYYDPEVCRFVTADSYVSTGQGILGYNRYAYCNNNPVMYVDFTGCSAIAIMVGIGVGIVAAITAQDIYHVTSDENGISVFATDDNVQIKNSDKIITPWVRYGYSFYLNHFNDDTKDVIQGSTAGVEFEWALHNYAAWLDFGGEGVKDVDIGKTIFADGQNHPLIDQNGEISSEGVMSVAMRGLYIVLGNPVFWIYDLIVNGGF